MPKELRKSYKISSAIDVFQKRTNYSTLKDDKEKPVFLFSSGWRSGSTLLQRLILSSGEIAMWGEPLGRSAIIGRLASSLTTINNKWPLDEYFDSETNLKVLSNKWVANLTPPLEDLRCAHRAFFKEWLGYSARSQFGLNRWGLKEVRLTIDHAVYLKWLFPKAKIIFICRKVDNSYLSWRGNRWGSEWPNYFTLSPLAFGRHWRILTEGFLKKINLVDGVFIRYEDLISQNFDLSKLASYLEVKTLNKVVLEKNIGSPDGSQSKFRKLPFTVLEKLLLRAVCGNIIRNLYPE